MEGSKIIKEFVFPELKDPGFWSERAQQVCGTIKKKDSHEDMQWEIFLNIKR